jgi:hypothetical protein
MGQLVGAYAVSHTAMMVRLYDPQEPQQAQVIHAFEMLRNELDLLAPDVLVVVGSEHMRSFFYDNCPQYCIAAGERSISWGDGGVPIHEVSLHQPFAQALLEYGIESGFDFCWSTNVRLDHGFMAPLHLLSPEMKYPVVPIFQNASIPPLPTFKRAAELGRLLKDCIEKRPENERVVIIGTGGLSHWVGTPEMGQINEAFDLEILDWCKEGNLESLKALNTDEVERKAGNGAQEIRNWVTVMAAVEGSRAEVLAYEPVHKWATGMALVRFPVMVKSEML